MLWQNNILIYYIFKARNFNITGFLFIIFILITLNSSIVKAVFNIPKTNILGLSGGIYYDNLEDINKFLMMNELPKLEPGYQYYYSMNLKTNYIPYIFDESHSVIYSIDVRLPIDRILNESGKQIKLNTYSFFAEFSAFESYLKSITVHPIVGFGYSKSILEIKLDDNKADFFQKLNPDGKIFDFEKSTLLFNLGGGIDYRTNLKDLTEYKINLLFSFNARYSMCLDAYRINDSKWKYNRASISQIPKYYAPGLSIELGLAIEYQIND